MDLNPAQKNWLVVWNILYFSIYYIGNNDPHASIAILVGYIYILVGGDWNHGFFDLPFSWEYHHPIWRTPWFFRGVDGQPPTRLFLTIINHIIAININHYFNSILPTNGRSTTNQDIEKTYRSLERRDSIQFTVASPEQLNLRGSPIHQLHASLQSSRHN